MSSPHSVFVYGTLKQDSLRASLWPCPPQRVVPAEIRGQLFDLGPYPAVISGDLRVGGERWDFLPEQIPETLRLLDRIEGYQQDTNNLYERKIVDSLDEAGTSIQCFTYFFADESRAAQYPLVQPDSTGICCWHAPPGSRPITCVDE